MNETQAQISSEVNNDSEKIKLTELSFDWRPEKILFRDEQLEKIREVFEFECSIDNEYEDDEEDRPCLVIEGVSGSGKTMVVSRVLEKYIGKYFFASAARGPTALNLLKSLFAISASTFDGVIEKAIEKLKQRKYKILVVDEVNKIRSQNESTLFFNALNEIWREIHFSSIFITNKTGFLEKIPSDGRRTFFPMRLNFRPYDEDQLFNILLQRLNLLKDRNKDLIIEDKNLQTISRHIFMKFDGSVRSLLKITKMCIKNKNFSEEFIEDACKKLVQSENLEELKDISSYERDFMKIIWKNKTTLIGRTINHNGEVLEDDDNKKLGIRFLDLSKLTPYSKGRVSQILDKLENYYGLIESENKNTGRHGGREKTIILPREKWLLISQLVYGDSQ